jgi:hypothetical protein
MLSTPSMKSAGNQIARFIVVTPGNDASVWTASNSPSTRPIGCKNFYRSRMALLGGNLVLKQKRQQLFVTNRIGIRDGASDNGIKIP